MIQKLIVRKGCLLIFLPCIVLSLFFALYLFSGRIFGSSVDREKLIIATSPDYAPHEFVRDGEIVGFEIDIIKEIAIRAGLEINIVPMSFSTIIGAVTSGKVDIGLAGFCITKEREKSVLFSIPYHAESSEGNYYVAVHHSDLKIESLKDLEMKSVAVQSGTLYQDFISDYNATHGSVIDVLSVDTNVVAMQMLRRGKVDVIFSGAEQASFIAKSPDVVVTKLSPMTQSIAMIAPYGSKYIRSVNDVILSMVKDGTISKIKSHWFESFVTQDLSAKKQSYASSLLWISYGVVRALQYTIVSALIGFLFGNLFAVSRVSCSKILRCVITGYISIVRGTPVLLQISIVYFAIPALFGFNMSIFTSGVIALSMNSSAYMAEILRGGINSIDRSQFDAAKALNLNKIQTFRDIIFPQVIKRTLPSLTAEVITLLKETSLVSVFGDTEIMRRASLVTSEYYIYFTPLLVAGATYYCISVAIGRIGYVIETRFMKHG